MDILIKNLEMPTNCFTCIFSELNDYGILVCIRLGKECTRSEVRSDCPLVALPSHGRLCDLDYLIEHETYNIEQALFDTDEVLEDLKNAPVIVEANNE